MRRGINFDTYDPARIEARRQAAKPAAPALDRHNAPGPEVRGCDECGDVIGPWWGDGGDTFCRKHAPEYLKRPGAAR